MVQKLSKKETIEFRNAFAVYDKDGDGKITVSELAGVMKTLRPSCPMEEITALMTELDHDHNGIIDFREFCLSIIEKRQDPYPEHELRESFSSCDKNGDGHISVLELRLTMEMLGQPMTEKETIEVMKIYDKNGDGEMDYPEFVIMANSQ